ncbi:MAG: oligosaccharide flippase family protein [Planctomycetes bacterium]|nr:oligosaccharide flippase family protein [Planctomycetota bacterium]
MTAQADDFRPKNHRSAAASAGWTAIGQFGSQGIAFAANLALVPFLDPAEYGVIVFAWALLALLDSLVDFGTGMALVQRPTFTQGLLDTAFTINLALAALGTVFLIAVGFVVRGTETADFHGGATATMLWQLAASCLLTALLGIHRSVLQRRLELVAVAKIQFANAVLRGGVSVALAATGHGVQSLVIGYYAGVLFGVVALWRTSRLRLHLRLDPHERRELLGYGVRIVIYNLWNTTLQRIDAFVLSATLGSAAVGLFSLARQLLLQPVEMGGLVVRSVLLPRLARLQGRPWRARQIYRRCDQMLAGLMVPGLLAIAILFEPIAGLLPERWHAVGPLVLPLLPAALAALLMQSPGSMMLANAQHDAMLRWATLRGGVLVAASTAGLWLDLRGVALLLGLLSLAVLPGLLTGPAVLLRLPRRVLARALGELLPAAALTGAVMAASRWLLARAELHPVPLVLIAGIAGAFTWLLSTLLLRAPVARISRRLWRHRQARR